MISIILSIIVLCIYIQDCNSLQFVNITSQIMLTDIFTNETLGLDSLFCDGMTIYKDPKDLSSTYLWFGLFGFINNKSSVESEVFTTSLEEYNGPIIIDSSDHIRYDGNSQCTSPITRDILTCTLSDDNIVCNIYFVKTDTLSGAISVTPSHSQGPSYKELFCFNDSYVIPWGWENIDTLVGDQYISVIDLNGNLLYNDIEIPKPEIVANTSQWQFATMAQNKAKISEKNNGLFNVKLQLDMKGEWAETVYNLYYYYTNVNEAKDNLIKMYSQQTFTSTILQLPVNDISLDLNDKCCYFSIYQQWNPSSSMYSFYGVLTDIYGQNVTVNGQNYTLLVDKISTHMVIYGVQSMDFSSLSSSDNEEYFAVIYANFSNGQYDTYTFSVYSLKYETNQYSLTNVGEFDSIMIDEKYDINGNSFYNLDGTNNVYFTWIQSIRNGNDFTDVQLYGQGFEIKQE